MAMFKFSRLDFLLTCVGLCFLLVDIVLDILAAVQFYQEKAYIRLGLLILFLVGSSLLVQAYSWLWYGYEDFNRVTKVEKAPSLGLLKILHVFQLGTYLRHMGVVEMSVCSIFFGKTKGPGSVAVFLSHDLAMLRIIEAFSESLPQLVLIVTTHIQRGQLDPITVLKAVGSACAVSFCVMSYHRSLRSFLPDKHTQTVLSSVVYFLWNLLLISARVVALALFASELPCFIFTHFICSWIVLFFCAWRSKTKFMDSKCGEWLYRATVGLIWYFNWFNVVEGRTYCRTLIYHIYILADITLLCGLWFWKMNPDLPNFNYEHVIAYFCISAVYAIGLLVKIFYYKFLHPNVSQEELKSVEEEESIETESPGERDADEVDFRGPNAMFRSAVIQVEDRTGRGHMAEKKVNKRMRNLAQNFYS